MGQQHNKVEKRNRRKAYLARVRERIKAQIKKEVEIIFDLRNAGSG